MIGMAIVCMALWFPFRYYYLIEKWERHPSKDMSQTDGQSMEWTAESHLMKDLKDLRFLEYGLNKTLKEHADPFVRNRCAMMLGMCSHLSDFTALEGALSDEEFYVRLAAAFAIWKHRYPGIQRKGMRGSGSIKEISFLTYMQLTTFPPYRDPQNHQPDRKIFDQFIEKVRTDFVYNIAGS
jgi:hypothetical protein